MANCILCSHCGTPPPQGSSRAIRLQSTTVFNVPTLHPRLQLSPLQLCTLQLCTLHGLGWTVDKLEVYLAEVRKELKRGHMHTYWPAYIIMGQKPLGHDPS